MSYVSWILLSHHMTSRPTLSSRYSALLLLKVSGIAVRAFCSRCSEEKGMSQPKDVGVALSWHERATMEARTVLETMDTPLELTDTGGTGKYSKREEILSGELSLTFVMKRRECDGA